MSQNLSVHPSSSFSSSPPPHTQTHFIFLLFYFFFFCSCIKAHIHVTLLHVRRKKTEEQKPLVQIGVRDLLNMSSPVSTLWQKFMHGRHCAAFFSLSLFSSLPPSLLLCISVSLTAGGHCGHFVDYFHGGPPIHIAEPACHPQSPTASSEPILWAKNGPACTSVCDCVCVCPSLLSLPLLFFFLLTERVPALCVFWLTTVKERRLFSTYPETLPCQDWDENPFFSAKSSQPGVSQQITHTHTAAAVGGRVIPGYKSHLDMQGSVANRAGQRHSKLSCCIRSQEQQGAPKRPRVIMQYINMLNQVKFSEAQEERLEMSSVAIAPLHLLHYGCCEYKTHAKLQYILFICTRIHLYVYKPKIQDVNMCRVWINNMKKMLSVEPITAVVLTNPSGFLTCGPFDILTSKLWFLRQTECTISLTTCFVLACCHI